MAFGTLLDTIPSARSYLTAPAAREQFWVKQLSAYASPRIGLVWSGSPKHTNDHERSIPFASFADVCADKNCRFFSLQKDARADDILMLKSKPEIIDLGASLSDYGETAAIVANLDLVITVDTSVAHLVGALGKPVWILLPFLPDYRWLLSRADSPWYPSAKLFRQPANGDWRSVMKEVSDAINQAF